MTTERKNISQPRDWWRAFKNEADREGLSLSTWIGKTCRDAIRKPETLSKRPPANRPKTNNKQPS